ncbi:MAG: hypothetical protein B6U87_01060 [Candidatus Aenigmarchaeota archaeon ex4484_52]|nr:MAG: hypothetical protein B6U87_01060 [Candidatus Aenigmarchaeota archaeon ex4484_52]
MDFGLILMYCIAFFGLFTSFFFLLVLFEKKKNLKTPNLKQYKNISIIVPAYNEEKTIKKTLDSLLDLNWQKEKIEIICIDDGSTDNTGKIIEKYKGKGIKLFVQKNKGKGAAMNAGLKLAKGEFVACLDADSFVDKNALKNMIGFFEDKSVMAVTPALKMHRPINWLDKIQRIEYMIGIYLRKTFSIINVLTVTPGPFSVYRMSFFKKYGGYDENNITEDLEIALRIQKHHYKIENSLNAFVYTKPCSDFSSLMKQRTRWYCGALTNFLKYRELFSREYGDFGVFLLPSSLISVFLVEILCFYLIAKFLNKWIEKIINWYYIGFDFNNLFIFHFDWFMINFRPLVTLATAGFLCGIAIVFISKKISQEKDKIKFDYLFYILVYLFLFASWWFVAIVYYITGKKIKW